MKYTTRKEKNNLTKRKTYTGQTNYNNMLLQFAINFHTNLVALLTTATLGKSKLTRMWASAQRDGCPAECRWRPLFNAAKFD